MSRSPWTGESDLHVVNEYFELMFNDVLGEKDHRKELKCRYLPPSWA